MTKSVIVVSIVAITVGSTALLVPPNADVEKKLRRIELEGALKAIGAQPSLQDADGRITGVSLDSTADDQTLRQLLSISGLEQLTQMNLFHTYIGDEGLRALTKVPSLTWLYLSSGPTITGEGFPSLAQLRHLHLRSTILSFAGATAISQLPALQYLDLTDSPVTNEMLQPLGGITTLEELHLDGTAVTDFGLKNLAQLPSLKSLTLARTRVTDAGLAQLASFPSLTSLDLSETTISDAGIPHLTTLPHLGGLRLDRTMISDAGLRRLWQLPGLIGISVEGIDRLTDDAFVGVEQAKQLTQISTSGTLMTDLTLDRLSKVEQLRVLMIPHSSFTLSGFDEFHKLRPEIRFYGELPRQQISVASSAVQPQQSAIRALEKCGAKVELNADHQAFRAELVGATFDDASLKSLEALPMLGHLTLVQSTVTDTGLEHLGALRQLKRLAISRCSGITDRGLAHLKGLTELQYLGIVHCPQLTDAAVDYITSLKDLEMLEFTELALTDEVFRRVADLANLKSLAISGAAINGSGLQHLEKLQKLETLRLRGCPIEDSALEHLSVLGSLKTADISPWIGTNPSKVSVEGIKKLQASNPSLTIRW